MGWKCRHCRHSQRRPSKPDLQQLLLLLLLLLFLLLNGCRVWGLEICHLLDGLNAKQERMYFIWYGKVHVQADYRRSLEASLSSSLTARQIELIANFQLLLSLLEDNNPILILTLKCSHCLILITAHDSHIWCSMFTINELH